MLEAGADLRSASLRAGGETHNAPDGHLGIATDWVMLSDDQYAYNSRPRIVTTSDRN